MGELIRWIYLGADRPAEVKVEPGTSKPKYNGFIFLDIEVEQNQFSQINQMSELSFLHKLHQPPFIRHKAKVDKAEILRWGTMLSQEEASQDELSFDEITFRNYSKHILTPKDLAQNLYPGCDKQLKAV